MTAASTAPPTTDLAIDLRNVVKVYKTGFRRAVRALEGVTMRVGRGEIYGLLGPNGAGKSTLVKSMMTVIRPTEADGQVLGQPIGHKPTLRRVGYLPESHRFPRYLTGRQVIEFFGGLQGVERRIRRRRAGELLETVGMAEWADQKITRYSKGMSQRIGLAQAMVADPDLILLDEPTDGVDPVARRQIRDVLARLRSEGKTVFINSHLLGELEMICDRVGIMVAGRLHSEGTVGELALNKVWHEIDFTDAPGTPPTREALLSMIQGMTLTETVEDQRTAQVPRAKGFPMQTQGPPAAMTFERGKLGDGETVVEWQAPTLRVFVTDPTFVQPILDAIRDGGYTLRRMQPVRPTLEDLFLAAVEDGGDTLAAGRRA